MKKTTWQKLFLMALGLVSVSALAALGLEPLGQSWGFRFGLVLSYLSALAGVWWLIQRWIGRKIKALPVFQQWLVRTLLYAGAMVATLWAVYLAQMLAFIPWPTFQAILQREIWPALGQMLARPFNPNAGAPLPFVRWQPIGAALFFLLVAVMVVSILLSYVQTRWQETSLRQALQQAELTALRAQMNPHFLFNTLNTIASYIRRQPEQAERLLLQLSDLLRYQFQQSGKKTVPLAQELRFAQQYVSLMQARFGEKLCVRWDVPAGLESIPVPGFLLQPLIENALQHGWTHREMPFCISISVRRSEQGIEIVVEDSGVGFDPSRRDPRFSTDHALGNLNQRLHLLYGAKDLLKIQSSPNAGTRVSIFIPEKVS